MPLTDWSEVLRDPTPFRPDLRSTDSATLTAMIGTGLSEAQVAEIDEAMAGIAQRAEGRQRVLAMIDIALRAGQFVLTRGII